VKALIIIIIIIYLFIIIIIIISRVITLEENVLQGGFGSAVLELLADAGILCPTLRLGLPDQFIEQGTQAELHARYGLDAAGITRSIRTFLETPAA
jgi:1-deoxy-D-xylulose-5-phosphate synthase